MRRWFTSLLAGGKVAQLVDSWFALKEQWLVTEIDQMMASAMTGSLDFFCVGIDNG